MIPRRGLRWILRPLLGSCALATLAALTGCGGQPLRYVGQASPPPAGGSPEGLRAGFERVDITPPPGPGLMGYGIEGAVARGYRNRLHARAMVLEDRAGERIAIVTLDLLAPSVALHRAVSALVIDSSRIGPDRLLLSATHTHAGPGHYFAVRGLDQVGSSVDGFDPEMLQFLSTRIAAAVLSATAKLQPAAAAWSVEPVWGASRIRSMKAFKRNSPRWESRYEADPSLPPVQAAVDPSWAMLRVDRVDPATGAHHPLGALSIFAVHGTGMPSGNDLFDSDLQGVLSRRMERGMDALASVAPGPIHLFANGAEGDVSPNWPDETRCKLPTLQRTGRPIGPRPVPAPEVWTPISDAARSACMASALLYLDTLTARLADGALEQYRTLGNRVTPDVSISRAFQVLPLSGSPDYPLLCDIPRIGVATPGGAPDGYTRIHGWRLFGLIPVGLEEGGSSLGSAAGGHCQAPKKRLLKPVWPLLTGPNMLPRSAQLSVVRIGGMLIGTLPGEPTTTVGGRTRAAMAAATAHIGIHPDSVLLLGLTNGYIDYVATPEEYSLQLYEGSSTLYGPQTATVLQDALARLASTLPHAGAPSPDVRVPDAAAFPGRSRRILPALRAPSRTVHRRMEAGWHGDTLVARWNDHPPGVLIPADGEILEIRRAVGGEWEVVTPDDDHELEVRWLSGTRWEARWTPCVRAGGDYRLDLLPRQGLPPLQSDALPAGPRECRRERPRRGRPRS